MIDPFDAMAARLADYHRREIRDMAQEILDTDRGVNFSITMLHLLWRIADGRTIPGTTETRRIASAWARWNRAGQRRVRKMRRAGQ